MKTARKLLKKTFPCLTPFALLPLSVVLDVVEEDVDGDAVVEDVPLLSLNMAAAGDVAGIPRSSVRN